MTIYTPILDGRSGPKYRVIADTMSDDIRSGTLASGTKLPTHRDLAYRLGVTVGTITRAYQELQIRGLTDGQVGSGTYVMGAGRYHPAFRAPRSPLLDMCGQQPDVADAQAAWRNSDARDVIEGTAVAALGEINLGMNRPPPGPESAAMARTLMDISQADGIEALTCYNPSPGMLHHREAMADFLREVGLNTQGTDIMLTHGAQHAMASSAMALLKAGDVILTEELTYPGFASIATTLGARIRPVAMDEYGILPDAFEAAIKASGARVAYLVPVLQNPTCATMTQERLNAIADIVKRHDMMIIEDDVYGFQPETRNLPLAELAPDNTIYINGFAKSFAPGLRIGAMRPPKALFNDIAQAVQITGWMIAPLMGEIATRWIRSGEAHSILLWHREEMKARNAIAADILKDFRLHGAPESLHVWMDLPDTHTADDTIRTLVERGIMLVGPENFTVGQTPAPRALRLCLGSPRTREDLVTALSHVHDVLASEPATGLTRIASMVM